MPGISSRRNRFFHYEWVTPKTSAFIASYSFEIFSICSLCSGRDEGNWSQVRTDSSTQHSEMANRLQEEITERLHFISGTACLEKSKLLFGCLEIPYWFGYPLHEGLQILAGMWDDRKVCLRMGRQEALLVLQEVFLLLAETSWSIVPICLSQLFQNKIRWTLLFEWRYSDAIILSPSTRHGDKSIHQRVRPSIVIYVPQ